MKKAGWFLFSFLAGAVCVWAGEAPEPQTAAAPQSAPTAAPAPAPEVKELNFYIGNWREVGQVRATAEEAFKPFTGSESCEWFTGGFAVVCRESLAQAAGATRSIYILSYDSARKLFTVYGTDSAGAVFSGTGTVEKGAWNWNVEVTSAGAAQKLKYTFRSGDMGTRIMEVETQDAKGAWFKIYGVTYFPRRS